MDYKKHAAQIARKIRSALSEVDFATLVDLLSDSDTDELLCEALDGVAAMRPSRGASGSVRSRKREAACVHCDAPLPDRATRLVHKATCPVAAENQVLRDQIAALTSSPAPIAMWLTCPSCGARHVDEGEFATKVHHTHACQKCGLPWRPAIVPTVGVKFLPGFRNEPNDDGFVDGIRTPAPEWNREEALARMLFSVGKQVTGYGDAFEEITAHERTYFYHQARAAIAWIEGNPAR